MLYSRWIDNKNLGVIPTILNEEFLGYHGGNNSLAKTYYIGKEETIIANEFLIALDNCICLILKFIIAFRHIEWVILVNLQHSIGEILHEHLYVEFVRRHIFAKISSTNSYIYIICCNRCSFGFFPQQFKFFFGK